MSSETQDTLQTLAEHAKDGKLVGIIVIPIYRDGKYMPILTDRAQRDLTWAAGALAACSHIVAEKAIEQGIEDEDA